ELWAEAWPYQNQKGMENPPGVLIHFIETRRRPLPKGYKQYIEQKEEPRTVHGQNKALRAEYRREVIKPRLKTIPTAWLERFEKDFQEFKESTDVLRSVKSKTAIEDLRLTHFEKFAEENPELSIIGFEEWKTRRAK